MKTWSTEGPYRNTSPFQTYLPARIPGISSHDFSRIREPHPELLGHERTPADLVADVMAAGRPLGDMGHPMLAIRRALDARAGRPPSPDAPDYGLIDEADRLPAWMRSH